MSFSGGRDRLVPKALELKKAWLLLIVGTGRPLSRQNATIPAYGTWTRKELEAHYRHLLDDLQEVLAVYVVSPRAALRTRATGWLAEQFDRWQAKGGGPFTISTVQQFEARVGTILARERLELPPYAEVLLQPGVSLAFRHPEYMLVRDLGLLVDLYLDAAALADSTSVSRPAPWAVAAGENTQALARAVVLACFSLLESYLSGLGRAYVMTNPNLDEVTRAKLLTTRGPLSKRITTIPAVIAGRACPLSIEAHPLSPLFDSVKRRRDAFVHCEPGPIESEHGYLKEAAFNDTSHDLGMSAIRCTHDAMIALWTFVHGRPGPRWLPELEPSGRFGKQNLQLVPRNGTVNGRGDS